MSNSVFKSYKRKAYPFKFRGKLITQTPLVGGIPSDPNVARRWLMTKFTDNDEIIREMVAEVVVERGLDPESEVNLGEATDEVVRKISLNGFRRNPPEGSKTHDPEHPVGELYIGGYQLKAALKEAASVAVAADKLPKRGWGSTNKGVKSFVAEHLFVVEERLYLGVTQPDEIQQRFVHTFQGNGIQYEEVVHKAEINFHVITDVGMSEERWAMLWLTGENQGIGATRSQGFGTYEVVEWEAVKVK